MGLGGIARAVGSGEAVEVFPDDDFTGCWTEAKLGPDGVEFTEKLMPPAFYVMEDGWPAFANLCRTLGYALGGSCETYQDRKVDSRNIVTSTRFYIHFKNCEVLP